MSCRVVSTTEDSTTSSLSDVASSKLAAVYRPALQPISQPTRSDQPVLVSARTCISTFRSPCSDHHVRICTIVSTCPQLFVLRVNTFSSSAMDMLRLVAPFRHSFRACRSPDSVVVAHTRTNKQMLRCAIRVPCTSKLATETKPDTSTILLVVLF